MDKRRVNATGARMIRGLYFIEMGEPLSSLAILKVAAKAGQPSKADLKTIAHVYHQQLQLGSLIPRKIS
jgi:hypothetical protein